MGESAAKATGLATSANTRVVPGDVTAGWQRCRRVAGGPAGANEHGQLLALVAQTPPDAWLVAAVSLRRRWSAQVSHGSQQWQQPADSGCLQQQQQRWSRQPPAAAGEAGDATSQPARACARGQMAPGADRGCPGPGRCARSRARPQRGRMPRARAWSRARRGHERGHERAERRGQIRRWRRSNSRRAAGRQRRLAGGPGGNPHIARYRGSRPERWQQRRGSQSQTRPVVQRLRGIQDQLCPLLTSGLSRFA